MVRTDGILVPIGRFDGAQWTQQNAYPEIWRNQSLSGEWDFWPMVGNRSKLEAGTAVMIWTFGEDTTRGLITEYSPRRVGANIDPLPKVGIAFSKQIAAVRMTKIDSTAPDWQFIRRVLLPAFEASQSGQFLAEDRAASRAPIEVKGYYRSDTACDGKMIYYFDLLKESHERYAQFTGFMVGTGTDFRLLNQNFSFGDGKELGPTIEPFAIFTIAGRLFLVLDVIPYEGGYSSIWELTSEGFKARANAY